MNAYRRRIYGAWLLAAVLPGLSGCAPAVVVAGAAGGGYAAHDRRSLGSLIDDQTLAFRTEGRINEDTETREYGHVNVTAYNGRVLITGEIPTEAAKARATEIANAEGARAVFNELERSAPTSALSRSSDILVQGRAKASLFAIDLPDFDSSRVKITVERGIVYLMGLVTPREAEAATEAIRQVSGVRKVVKIFEYIS